MTHYTHSLTALEIACGVTLEHVASELARVYMPDNDTVVVAGGLAPALASSVARCALARGGVARAAEYAGHNTLGLPIYRAEV